MRSHVPLETLRHFLSYDESSGVVVWIKNPKYQKLIGKEAGGIGHLGYKSFGIAGVRQLAHRVAWALHYGANPQGEIDHINGNRADNKIDNLRLVTHAQNMKNRQKNANSSTLKGALQSSRFRFRARITSNGKIFYLGNFASEEEAHAAYCAASLRLHGEFGRIE